MNRLTLIVAATLPAMSSAAHPSDAPICADRPGQTTGTCTVPAGHWQLETSLADWSLQKDGGARETALTIGATVVKYGLTARSDVEVEMTPWQRSGDARGFGDITILYKNQLTRDDASLQVALLPAIKAPSAKRTLGNGKWEAAVRVPVSYTIGDTPFAIGLTPELDWAADGDGRGHHVAMVQVASLGWQASERFDVAADLSRKWDWDPAGTASEAAAGASGAYLLSGNLQVDAGATFGLNHAASAVELYAGISKRF